MHEFYFSELKGLRAWIGADQQESIFQVWLGYLQRALCL